MVTIAPASGLTRPLAARLWAWCQERFPPKNLVFIGMLYLAALLYGRALAVPGRLIEAADAAGFLAAVGFFLMLRVYDEHKDYELDVKNHPQRVLQSGLITLGHLKVVWGIAVAAQLGVSLWRDGGAGVATTAWAVTMGWGALMAKEFFVHAWLSRRLVLYALSHMLIMPMAIVWLAHLGARGRTLPAEVLLLGGLAFVSGFAYEIARKTKAPEEERPTVDSYTKTLGVRGTVLAIAMLLSGQALLLVLLMHRVGASAWGWKLGLLATVLPSIWALARFSSGPDPDRAKKVEGMAGLAMVAGYALLSAAILATHARG